MRWEKSMRINQRGTDIIQQQKIYGPCYGILPETLVKAGRSKGSYATAQFLLLAHFPCHKQWTARVSSIYQLDTKIQ